MLSNLNNLDAKRSYILAIGMSLILSFSGSDLTSWYVLSLVVFTVALARKILIETYMKKMEVWDGNAV